MFVYVLNRHGRPLMPCPPGKRGVSYKKLTLLEQETNYLIERRMRCSSHV